MSIVYSKKNNWILPFIAQWSIKDYLVDENTIWDTIHDKLIFENLGESAWLITAELKKYREMISSAKTKEEVESLKTKILTEIGWTNNESQTSEPSEANNLNSSQNETSNNTTATSEQSSTSSEKAKVDTSSESYEIDHLNFSISPEAKQMWDSLKWKEKPDLEPFACALKVYNNEKWKIKNTKYLTVVDFTKKKWKNRFFVINMENNTIEHAVKVWHWKNTGNERANQFSNREWSKQSSLWGYLLPDTITKSPNKSWSWLRMITWLESSNNKAAKRGIAVHAWWENGSEWCFTLPKDISRKIMEQIKWWFLFAYAESKDYFAQSNYFKENADGKIAA